MTTTRRHVIYGLLVGLLLLGGTACTTKTCVNDVCTLSMSGESSIDFDDTTNRNGKKYKTHGPRLVLEQIEQAAVTISVDGQRARLELGQQATLDVLVVKILSISGRDVKLETRPI